MICLAVALSGCVSVRSLSDVTASDLPGEHVLIDGARVHVEDHGAGDPVVLVHGFGGSTYSWRHIIPSLARSHRVIAVDLLGFGYSERPRERNRYSRVEQVALLLAVLDALGIDDAHWVGHSYGGGLVTSLAYRYPQRVRSLVLIDTTAPDYAERRRSLAGWRPLSFPYVRGVALRPRFARRALERSFFDDSSITGELVSAYLDRVRIEGVVDAWVGLTAPQPDPGPEWSVKFAAIARPVLVLWGEEDRLITLDSARRSVASLPAARLVTIPECGHIPMEEQPEVVAREMLRFFAEQTAVARSSDS